NWFEEHEAYLHQPGACDEVQKGLQCPDQQRIGSPQLYGHHERQQKQGLDEQHVSFEEKKVIMPAADLDSPVASHGFTVYETNSVEGGLKLMSKGMPPRFMFPKEWQHLTMFILLTLDGCIEIVSKNVLRQRSEELGRSKAERLCLWRERGNIKQVSCLWISRIPSMKL
ncbi:hypothetical protein A6R68_21319, partial [Neotoma lepida]